MLVPHSGCTSGNVSTNYLTYQSLRGGSTEGVALRKEVAECMETHLLAWRHFTHVAREAERRFGAVGSKLTAKTFLALRAVVTRRQTLRRLAVARWRDYSKSYWQLPFRAWCAASRPPHGPCRERRGSRRSADRHADPGAGSVACLPNVAGTSSWSTRSCCAACARCSSAPFVGSSSGACWVRARLHIE